MRAEGRGQRAAGASRCLSTKPVSVNWHARPSLPYPSCRVSSPCSLVSKCLMLMLMLMLLLARSYWHSPALASEQQRHELRSCPAT